MTRAHQAGILVVGVLAAMVAGVSFVSGVLALASNGFFAAIPALLFVPAAFGLIAWRAIAYAGPALARPEGPARADLASLTSFIERAQAGKPARRKP